MEISINIPRNNYVQNTEVRDWVVQGICEAFLSGKIDQFFHPFGDGPYRYATVYIYRRKGDEKFFGFTGKTDRDERYEYVRFTGAEMKAAFKALINAGYHIFESYNFCVGRWLGYLCYHKPYHNGDKEVFEFNDFID